jgi:DNA-binding CsgD family transcriptional regulator
VYGHATANLGRLDEALALATAGRALGERLDDRLAVAFADLAGGMTLLFQSQYNSALPRLESALAAYRAENNLFYLCNTLFTMTVATALAEDPRAAGYGEEAVVVSEGHGAQWSLSWALATLALHRWQQDQPEQAITLLRRGLDLRRLNFEVSHEAWGTGFSLEILAWALTATGQHQPAATLLGACHNIWRSAGVSMAERGPIKVHHDVCEQRARAGLGQPRYDKAFQAGTEMSSREAITYALGDTSLARSPSAARVSQSAKLTRREREIAALVADGLSDREIAAHLFLSERTVNGHVGHVLAKLSFTSRAQIAAWVTTQRPPHAP